MRQVLVTGASSDIGLAVCQKYLDAGWRVIGQYRTERAELDALQQSQFKKWQCDFSYIKDLEGDLRDDKFDISKSDAYVSLAASLSPTEFSQATSSDILNALSINLIPGLLIMQCLGPKMVSRGFGRIVHGSSIGIKFGGGEQSFTYSLSKHAQEFIPQECRKWAGNGVYVNVVRIGVTDTRLHSQIPDKNMAERAKLVPARRLASSKEIADALFWLGSDNNGFTTNDVISVSGGE
jgi:NAD(P)-dependent dehydrogenase (short-subunit alcohol dehydrogenase family)